MGGERPNLDSLMLPPSPQKQFERPCGTDAQPYVPKPIDLESPHRPAKLPPEPPDRHRGSTPNPAGHSSRGEAWNSVVRLQGLRLTQPNDPLHGRCSSSFRREDSCLHALCSLA